MRPTTRRLVSVSVLILGISIVGFILGAIFYWPSQVVLDSSADHNVTAGNPIQGNVTSIPLPPMIALAVFAFLAPTASVINIDPVVSGKHVSIRSSLQEQTRSASARRRSMPDQPTGSIIMNTAVVGVHPDLSGCHAVPYNTQGKRVDQGEG